MKKENIGVKSVDIRKQASLMRLRKLLGEGPRMIPHSALSDDIAGEEVKLKNECLH